MPVAPVQCVVWRLWRGVGACLCLCLCLCLRARTWVSKADTLRCFWTVSSCPLCRLGTLRALASLGTFHPEGRAADRDTHMRLGPAASVSTRQHPSAPVSTGQHRPAPVSAR